MPSSGELEPCNGNWSRKQMTPIRRLVSGPTTAIWNSTPGLVGSRSILETPPKMNRVMFFTGRPRRRATNEWASRSEEHTSELQSRLHLVCRLLLEKKKNKNNSIYFCTII